MLRYKSAKNKRIVYIIHSRKWLVQFDSSVSPQPRFATSIRRVILLLFIIITVSCSVSRTSTKLLYIYKHLYKHEQAE